MVEGLSGKVSQQVREYQDDHIRSGKKMIPNLNFQLNDKLKLNARIMDRLIYGLGDPSKNTSWSSLEKKGSQQ